MSSDYLKSLFEPKSIAIIGASQNPNKIGHRIVENILQSGYKGKIFPINPKAGKVANINAYTSVYEVIDQIDSAIITIPATFVFDAVKTCAKKKIKNLIIITSGFSEIGNTNLEKKIAEFAYENQMRILGPNIFGLYCAKSNLNATFGPTNITPGNIAIITQSGAIGIAMIGKTKTENIGLSNIISVGNKSDIDEIDLLEYLIKDDNTNAILMYIEGIQGGQKLVKALKKSAKKKPIIVIKSGRSKRGAIAAASHTGSLAGADEVFDNIIKQCNIIRAESIQQALDWTKFIANSPAPKGKNTVIITNGGGIGVLAADASEKYNLHLLDDNELLKNTFSKVVPDFGSTKNPVDITGAATAKDYDDCLSAALYNNSIHSVICLGCETAVFNAKDFTDIVQKQFNQYKTKKPIVFSIFGGEEVEKSISDLRKQRVPIYADVYEAVSSLGSFHTYIKNKNTINKDIEKLQINTELINSIIDNARKEKRHFLLAHEAQRIIKSVNLPFPQSKIAKNIDEAVMFAKEIGYPVVMKIVSKDIIHKSDAGGIALDLENKTEVIEAYESIIYNCKKYNPEANIKGIEIAEMANKGVETIVGARRDPSFGPVVMFGLGGIYVEVMKDITFRSFPLSYNDIANMISEIRTYPLLLGIRGEQRKDIESITDTIIKIGTIINSCPDIADIEINPLVVYEQGLGAKAIDVRILLTSK